MSTSTGVEGSRRAWREREELRNRVEEKESRGEEEGLGGER